MSGRLCGAHVFAEYNEELHGEEDWDWGDLLKLEVESIVLTRSEKGYQISMLTFSDRSGCAIGFGVDCNCSGAQIRTEAKPV